MIVGRFISGNSGGPGRPPGSRNRLAGDFLADLCGDWQHHGVAVIAKVRKEYPAVYFRTIATLVPRELPLPLEHTYSHLSDEELADRLAEVAAKMKRAIKVSEA
jgi:hypothetical protein